MVSLTHFYTLHYIMVRGINNEEFALNPLKEIIIAYYIWSARTHFPI